MISAEQILRADDIVGAAQFMLTQPRRAVVRPLAVTQQVHEK